jgi:hypothetical protein
MIGGVLQDWTTVRAYGSSGQNVGAVTQTATSYLDLGDYDDIVFFVDVRELTQSVSLQFQTSPSRDDASFQAIAPAITLAVSATPVATRILAAYSPIPLARFVRWTLTNLSAAGAWDATFRITYAVFAPGVA